MQFNCQEGDTVIVAQRKHGRMVQEFLTVVQTGVVSARESLSAGRQRMTLKGLQIEG
jgi:hypothetical protein